MRLILCSYRAKNLKEGKHMAFNDLSLSKIFFRNLNGEKINK